MNPVSRIVCSSLFVVCLTLVAGLPRPADAQLLSTHYPEPSTNGAAHYNRALLAMSSIPLEERAILAKPIWEGFQGSSKEAIAQTIAKLTFTSRHALRAALKGTSCDYARFGLDYADYGHGLALPHAGPMLELGRLMTLAGVYAQIREEWEQAAVLLFEGIRMGRHMAEQPTLAETLVGVQILENNYFALAFWAAKCPDTKLVRQAFLRFEAGTEGIVKPAFALAHEASIIERQMDKVTSAFPDGPWAEMLLDAMGAFTIAEDKTTLEQKAKQLCLQRGVPAQAFESKANFDDYVKKVRALRGTYFRSIAACMTLPPLDGAKAALGVYQRAKAELAKFSNSDLLAPEHLVAMFATHEGERTMARVALAVAASRTAEGFPKSLTDVAARFSGKVPASPYDGSPLQYELLDDGKEFALVVPEARVENVIFSQVAFSSLIER